MKGHFGPELGSSGTNCSEEPLGGVDEVGALG